MSHILGKCLKTDKIKHLVKEKHPQLEMAKQGDRGCFLKCVKCLILLNSLQLEHYYIIIDNKVMQPHLSFLHKANV